MQNNYISLTLTSPPYGNSRAYNGYSFEFEKIAQELFRVTKDGGIVIWVVGDETINGSETGDSFRQALYFMSIGFKLNDTQIYYKNNPMPTSGPRYAQHFEYMFCFSKGKPLTFNPILEQTIYRGTANMKNRGKEGTLNYRKAQRKDTKKIGNVFSYTLGAGHMGDAIAHKHPAIFSEQLATDQIVTWSNPGETVFDPMCGSGSTLKCAALNGRNWIGSEISSEYCAIAQERLKLNGIGDSLSGPILLD